MCPSISSLSPTCTNISPGPWTMHFCYDQGGQDHIWVEFTGLAVIIISKVSWKMIDFARQDATLASFELLHMKSLEEWTVPGHCQHFQWSIRSISCLQFSQVEVGGTKKENTYRVCKPRSVYKSNVLCCTLCIIGYM